MMRIAQLLFLLLLNLNWVELFTITDCGSNKIQPARNKILGKSVLTYNSKLKISNRQATKLNIWCKSDEEISFCGLEHKNVEILKCKLGSKPCEVDTKLNIAVGENPEKLRCLFTINKKFSDEGNYK